MAGRPHLWHRASEVVTPAQAQALTQGQSVPLLQDVPVEALLGVVQPTPLLPGEVQSHILKSHRHLQHKIPTLQGTAGHPGRGGMAPR